MLINLERFPFTATTLCRYLNINITKHGWMIPNFYNVLHILPNITSILFEDETFPILTWVYIDLVEKFPEGVRL